MVKRESRRSAGPTSQRVAPPPPRLQRGALQRIHLGQSFAEYDLVLRNHAVFVQTPALQAAIDHRNPHCFFVGRRGTGKTATTLFLSETRSNVTIVRPQVFSPNPLLFPITKVAESQRSFRSLLAAFRRTIQDEVIFDWIDKRRNSGVRVPDAIQREYDRHSACDFDLRALEFISSLSRALASSDDTEWLTEIKVSKTIARAFESADDLTKSPYVVVLDAIDDYWDRSADAVLYLTALMHASLEINSQMKNLRVLVFLRENIFERVRQFDPEFARLETCVVGLDWTTAQLQELIERRVNAPLNTKLALDGSTWDAFFENGDVARELVLEYCQHRPRDVLTYCNLALDAAQSNKHDRVMIEDLQDARRRFSDGRLKDLSDEYQENYPQIAIVLESFYGLGQRLTTGGVEDFLHKILDDPQVASACKEWLYQYASIEKFSRLLYDLGFFGLVEGASKRERQKPLFRSLGPQDTTPPPISQNSEFWIHPSYHQALDLQDVLVDSLMPDQSLRRSGMILELPGTLTPEQYRNTIDELSQDLKTLPKGQEASARFETIVGEVIRLCLFRPLTNVQDQVRDHAGTVRRDWVASNRAEVGFWEMIRQRYGATQVVFECKNYEDLDADDFHQAEYYMTEATGKFVVLLWRGVVKAHYYAHIGRIHSQRGGLILLLNDKDLQVFIRQSINGKVKDDHLREAYDMTVRRIS